MRPKTIVLLSGGMDSVSVLYDVARSHEVVATLSFDYGSKHNPKELPYARWHSERLSVRNYVVNLGFMGGLFSSDLLASGGAIPDGHYEEASMKKTVVPFRNGIMLSIAGGMAESVGAQYVAIAAHAGDHAIYPDCRESFMQAMGDAIRLGTYAEVRILRPFIDLKKAQIARRGHDLGVDFSQTWSCYKGGEIHCGSCGTCVERREAFELAGIPDPTTYTDQGPLPPKPF
jgi:7-cyano-7-deazaguanine synthase